MNSQQLTATAIPMISAVLQTQLQTYKALLHEEQLLLRAISNLVLAQRSYKCRKVKKWLHKIKERRRRVDFSKPARPKEKRNRNPEDLFTPRQLYPGLVGVDREMFDEIYERTYPIIMRVRTQRLCAGDLTWRCRLALVLNFLRHAPSFSMLAATWKTSEGTAHRAVTEILPCLCEALQSEIEQPDDWNKIPYGFGGAQFIIDCTSHFRNRVHPRQHLYYRGDKHAHFLTAQVVVSLRGLIYFVVFAYGHNNDQGVFNHTWAEMVHQLNIVGLGDRGYSHPNLLTPDDIPQVSLIQYVPSLSLSLLFLFLQFLSLPFL